MPPHFSASAGTQALTETYTRIFNKWAFARTTAKGTKTMLQTQTSESHSNQELFILKKEEGSWKIARYAFSTMKPLVQDGIRRS
ncbi:hypothetical protein IL306_004513 [Fusarium sp. DS 682]|nr:hypothetical protein IL306_004513 [Fusarium sp. DS 682]